MAAEETSRVTVATLDHALGASLVQKVTGVEDVPARWVLDTKYYTAELEWHVSVYGEGEGVVEAPSRVLLLAFEREDEFEALAEACLAQAGDAAPELCLAVAHGMVPLSEDARTRVETWGPGWAIEAIDLADPCPEQIDGPFAERVGVPRVIEALGAHMWPNLVMKDRPRPAAVAPAASPTTPLSAESQDLERRAQAALNTIVGAFDVPADADTDPAAATDPATDTGMEDMLAQMMGGGGGGRDPSDGLGQALQTMREMRHKMADLPDNERREVSANIALAFLQQLEGM